MADGGGMQELIEGDPEQIGPSRLLGPLGAGGRGTVYLAQSPSRPVAQSPSRPVAQSPSRPAADRHYAREAEGPTPSATAPGGAEVSGLSFANPTERLLALLLLRRL
jgi:hypothetical protein